MRGPILHAEKSAAGYCARRFMLAIWLSDYANAVCVCRSAAHEIVLYAPPSVYSRTTKTYIHTKRRRIVKKASADCRASGSIYTLSRPVWNVVKSGCKRERAGYYAGCRARLLFRGRLFFDFDYVLIRVLFMNRYSHWRSLKLRFQFMGLPVRNDDSI